MQSDVFKRSEHCHRLCGLQALIVRQQIEQALDADPASAPRWQPMLEKIADAVGALDVGALDADEKQLLAAPWGAFAASDVAFATWRIEHMRVLLARLGILAPPPLDREANEDVTLSSVPLLVPPNALEPLVNLPDANAWAESSKHHALWKWRLDTEWGHRRGQRHPGVGEYSAFISTRVKKMPEALGAVEGVNGFDLVIDGAPIESISQSTLVTMRCVHHERAAAFAWEPSVA